MALETTKPILDLRSHHVRIAEKMLEVGLTKEKMFYKKTLILTLCLCDL